MDEFQGRREARAKIIQALISFGEHPHEVVDLAISATDNDALRGQVAALLGCELFAADHVLDSVRGLTPARLATLREELENLRQLPR